MKLKLRNGIVVETDDDYEGFVRAISIPSDYTGNWYVGCRTCLYFGHTGAYSPLEWLGGAYGNEYDVVSEEK